MKTNKWMILLLLVFCRCANEGLDNKPIQYDEGTTLSRGEYFPIVSDRYEYLVPGTEEWNQLVKTGDVVVTVSQLPDDVLKSISTPGLIDALVHAPLFLYTGIPIGAVDPTEYYWHSYYEDLNSAGELFQRKDAGEALVAYYKLVNFDGISKSTRNYYEDYARLVGLEGLFTKQEVLATMNHEKKKEAVGFILKIYNFKNYHRKFRTSLMFFIMLADQYEPIVQYAQEHLDFALINEGFFRSSDPNAMDIIVSCAENFINDKK